MGVNLDEPETAIGGSDVVEPQFSRRKSLLFGLIICVSFFVGLETLARVTAFAIYDRSPFFLLYGFRSSMASEIDGHSAARKGYAKFPPNETLSQYGMFTDPTPIRINAAGLRGVDFDPEKPPKTLRVVSLGGSSTFGFYNRDEYTYPAILQRKLAAEPALGAVTPEVINAGVPHAKSENLLAMLQGEILDYGADVVTVYTGYNDAVFTLDANMAQRLSTWLHGHFASYVALKTLISAMGGPELHSRWTQHGGGASPEYVRRQVKLHVEHYVKNVTAIVERCSADQVEVILIKQPINLIYPNKSEENPGYRVMASDIGRRLDAGQSISAEETGHFIHSRLMVALDQFAVLPGVRVVDFIPMVDENPEFLASYVHLSEQANDALALLLMDTIVSP